MLQKTIYKQSVERKEENGMKKNVNKIPMMKTFVSIQLTHTKTVNHL